MSIEQSKSFLCKVLYNERDKRVWMMSCLYGHSTNDHSILLKFNLSWENMVQPTLEFSPGFSEMTTGRRITDKTNTIGPT